MKHGKFPCSKNNKILIVNKLNSVKSIISGRITPEWSSIHSILIARWKKVTCTLRGDFYPKKKKNYRSLLICFSLDSHDIQVPLSSHGLTFLFSWNLCGRWTILNIYNLKNLRSCSGKRSGKRGLCTLFWDNLV